MSACRAALCKDEAVEQSQIAGLCREILAAQGIEAEIVPFSSTDALPQAAEGEGTAFDLYLLDIEMKEGTTARAYQGSIELHIIPRIGSIKLNKLIGWDIQKLYKDLMENSRLRKAQKSKQPGLSSTTVRGIHMMLYNALDRAVNERLILCTPTEDCIIPKIQKQEMKILHPEDMKAYLKAAERRGVLPMFYLELVSGVRKGELVALRWEDLDAEHRTIAVSKQALGGLGNELVVN